MFEGERTVPSYADLFRIYGRIGLQSFGGPAAQIALMHKVLVEDRNWLSEQEYLRALSFCMLLPGPEAMQLATYSGWQQRGIIGGLSAGGLFVLPGAVIIALLAVAYGTYGNQPWAQSLFLGIQAAVVVIVVDALRKVSQRAVTGPLALTIAALSFLSLYVFAVPFPLVIAAAACIGWFGFKTSLSNVQVKPVSAKGTLPVILIGSLIWALPLILSMALNAKFLTEIGLFFSKLAVVSFGGAYAVLAYMTQVVVTDFGWLSPNEMLDALGLAETTPGPLILVTQFVAMLAGLSEGRIGIALAAGFMTLWVTFVPCLIWIFAGAPYIEWLSGQPRLQAALKGITAAVVGVIANLSLWFAVQVFFNQVTVGPFNVISPILSSINVTAVVVATFAAMLLLIAKQPLWRVLILCAWASFGLEWAFGA